VSWTNCNGTGGSGTFTEPTIISCAQEGSVLNEGGDPIITQGTYCGNSCVPPPTTTTTTTLVCDNCYSYTVTADPTATIQWINCNGTTGDAVLSDSTPYAITCAVENSVVIIGGFANITAGTLCGNTCPTTTTTTTEAPPPPPTTTTTTTTSCITNGFPTNAYAALFWSQGEVDTSITISCDGNPVVEPSQSKSVWIAFFSDAGLTTPLATTLNSYSITVGGTPYLIGSGSTEYAYFIDYFPYSSNPLDPFTCIPGETVFEPLPSLSANACFTVVTAIGITPGDMIIQRGAGDPTTNDYTADMANCLYGPGSGTAIGVTIDAGQAGPITQSNIAGYCNITMRQLVLAQGYTITIVGTANDGSSGETISIPFAISTTVNSVKNYFLDGNHSITVTVDEIP
jgi:hypothetical protein